MKRRRTSGGSVTGGTGDVKPQYITAQTNTAGAVDDYVVNSIVLPVPRFGTTKAKTTVFEILSVDWYIGILDDADPSGVHFAFLTTATNRSDGDTSTLASFVTDLLDPRTFAAVSRHRLLSGAAGQSVHTNPLHVDLTDDNGNGVLVATDRLILVGGAVGNTAADNYIAKILYRQVDIGIEEYVGIVQSQVGTVS